MIEPMRQNPPGEKQTTELRAHSPASSVASTGVDARKCLISIRARGYERPKWPRSATELTG
jgi:hypothetical protein